MTHPTKRRTFSKERWELAQRRWKAWEDDASTQMREEWRDWRHLAAMEAGIIDPPEGGSFDSWASENPSQLALLTRAIRETPDLLRQALLAPRVHSWAAVIAIVIRGLDERMAEAELYEERDEVRRSYEPDREEATESMKAIFERLRAL